MTKSCLIFIDPGYLQNTGHYENYARSISAEATIQFTEFYHYVNREVSEEYAKSHSLIRWFPCKAHINYPDLKDQYFMGFYTDSFASKLLALLRKHIETLSRDDSIYLFMYTGHPRLLPLIAEVVNLPEFNKYNISVTYNLFYVSNSFSLNIINHDYIEMITEVAKALTEKDKLRRIKIFADSKRIIKDYQNFFNQKLNLLPIPFGVKKTVENKKLNSQTIKLGYLGYTHSKQGYQYMKPLYMDILRKPELSNVILKIRHNITDINASIVKDLRTLVGSTERIENYVNKFTDHEYDQFFEDSDIILIPYQFELYPIQTSGVVVDALSRSKPIIVPENTWLSDQIEQFGAGVKFNGRDYESLLCAIIKATKTIDSLRKKASNNIEKFVEFHSPKTLICCIKGVTNES